MTRFHPTAGVLLFAASAAAGAIFLGTAPTPAAPVPTLAPEEAWRKARCDGRYRMLLQQIKVENDAAKYGAFNDLGYRDQPEYAGYKNLPQGWWVYVAPHWYIWRETTKRDRPKRPWGPEQAAGEPDVQAGGESQLAWCAATQGQQDEWLLLEYAEPVVPTALLVYENYCPGALERLTVFKLDGTEVEAWKGKDPTGPGNVAGVSEVPLTIDFKVSRVKIYLGTKALGNWHEIDAVGLRDRDKKMRWAVAVEASSTYARPQGGAEIDKEEIYEDRIRRLEDEVSRLRELVEELRKDRKDR
jgi:hypothetical protein